MASPTRIMIGAVLLFLIVGAGFAAGFYFNFKASPTPDNGLQPFQAAPVKINNRTYTISPPSIGAAIHTKKVPLQFSGGVANIILTSKEAAEIHTGMRVALYDKQDQLVGVPGEVTTVDETSQAGKASVAIKMLEMGIIPENSIAKGEIVITRESAVSRLPPKAFVVKKDQEQPMVWEISESDTGTYRAYLRGVHVTIATSQFNAFDVPLGSSNVFILDPDQKLEDGQSINVKKVLYAGPEYTEEQIADNYMKNFQEQRKIEFDKIKLTIEEQKQVGLPSGGCSAPASGATQQFIDKIRDLPSSQPSRSLSIDGPVSEPPQP